MRRPAVDRGVSLTESAEITFTAPEYQADGSFASHRYRYRGNTAQGWTVYRDDRPWLTLGRGYRMLKTAYCGICSTDLARHRLPFPLPQITGHEVVVAEQGRLMAVEINASHLATGEGAETCPWCRSGLSAHCPARLTLGIDRLPGGFAPYVLAPQYATHVLPPAIDACTATLVEPLAAALRALDFTPPRDGDRVAVLGAGRLGGLLIVALEMARRRDDRDFSITAIVRHERAAARARSLGADEAVRAGHDETGLRESSFDLVFDTSGSPAGFELALHLASRAVHLKSTHGLTAAGLTTASQLVINEMALLPWRGALPQSGRRGGGGSRVWLSSSLAGSACERACRAATGIDVVQSDVDSVTDFVECDAASSGLPGFDLAVIDRIADVDRLMQGVAHDGMMPLNPCAALVYCGNESQLLAQALSDRGLEIHTSRCGDFAAAIALLADHDDLVSRLRDSFVTDIFPLQQLPAAFRLAADGRRALKVIVDTTGEDVV